MSNKVENKEKYTHKYDLSSSQENFASLKSNVTEPYASKRENPSNIKRKSLEGMSINDFLLGKKLGEGRFGNVFMAIHKKTGAIFALKRVPKATLKQNMMIDQFALEVRIQASFNHPNIVSIYAVFDDN